MPIVAASSYLGLGWGAPALVDGSDRGRPILSKDRLNECGNKNGTEDGSEGDERCE